MTDRFFSFAYILSVVIRLAWTFIVPQRGYIHPDEFFQGPQIVFGDIFHQNLTRTHEFQGPAPLRSVAILYLLYGLPVLILSYFSNIPFDWKLIFPRTTILVLAFLSDWLFYRLIKFFYPDIDQKQRWIIMNYYAFAHVTLVFFTRTLSNSFEAFLFLALIYAIASNLVSILAKMTDHPVGNVSLIFSSVAIGIICSLGIFNRPTFPVFALVPILYWLMTIVSYIVHPRRAYSFLGRVVIVIFGTFLLTSFFLIRFDSSYYQENWVICPWNFLRYNVNPKNLGEHGLHPPWLHLLVNAHILFGPLHCAALIWLISRVKCLRQLSFDRSKIFSSNYSVSTLLAFLYFVPFIPLSCIPHQEARFLLPLVFPLILLIVPRLITHRPMFHLWCLFNLLVSLLYGHLHQGGLIPALRFFDQSIPSNSVLLTYHTYMPPDYLALPLRKNGKTNEKMLIDLQGASPEHLQLTVEHVLANESMHSMQFFVLLPFSRRTDLNFIQEKELVKQFSFHLDLDHPINPFLFDHFRLEFYRLDRI